MLIVLSIDNTDNLSLLGKHILFHMSRSAFFNSCYWLLGLVCGWYLNGYISSSNPAVIGSDARPSFTSRQPTPTQNAQWADHYDLPGAKVNTQRVVPTKVTSNAGQLQNEAASEGVDANSESDPLLRLKQLLRNRRYAQAIDFYAELERNHLSSNSSLASEARRVIFDELSSLLKRESYENFTDLIEAFLAVYYSDDKALNLLAEYNFKRGYYFEAVNVFQLLFLYLPPSEEIRLAFSDLVKRIDEQLLHEKRLSEALSLYDHLLISDYANPRYMLRQAEIYLLQNDRLSAELLLNDIRYEPAVAARVEKLLEQFGSGDDSPEVASLPKGYPKHRIPLAPHGNHFLIKTVLNRRADVAFMIDTGASITSLSRAQFEHMESRLDARLEGQRLFKTANGVSRAEIYTIPFFQMGDAQLKDVVVAVLPNLSGHGLLGMNVLRHFRFEINQDEKQLWLGERRGQ